MTQTEIATPAESRTERYARRALLILSGAAILMLAAQAAAMLWARHEFTQAESVVAIQCAGLASGQPIYQKLDRYPYTVSAYMPSFYLLDAGLHRLGLPVLAAGRLISLLAFLGILALCWRILTLLTGDRYAAWAGTLLVACAANLNFWATVGQVDMLGLFFSLAALYSYYQYAAAGQPRRLAASACFVFLALFTKQTMLAVGAAILLALALEDRRRAAWFTFSLGAVGGALALWLNHFTAGGFFDNTLWANINPFSAAKLLQHLRYLTAADAGLIVLALSGLRPPFPREARQARLLYIYLALSAGLLVVTGSKIGSDLNYQIETVVALGLCAGWSLHRLRFFRECFRGSRSAVTLLQAPLLLQVVMSLIISGKILLTRLVEEPLRRREYAQLRPYLAPGRGPVLSVQLDPLLQAGRRLEVEPLIYTLLVQAGRIDPEPVRRDLLNKKFSLVILYDDIFEPPTGPQSPERPTLPAVQLAALRSNYRLVRHIPGPLLNGDYLYEPLP